MSSAKVEANGLSSTMLLCLLSLFIIILHSPTSLRAVVAAPLDKATMKHEGVYMLVTVVPYLQCTQHFTPLMHVVITHE